jgi:hypothetical protein
MSNKGIIRFALLTLLATAASAQTPPAQPGNKGDDLDVTMRVIVDPNAKVPDEIMRRIPLPKPATLAPSSDSSNANGKPSDAGSQGQQHGTDAHGQGRDFGQQVADEAKQRSEEARRNQKPPPGTPGIPGPPRTPPGRTKTPPPPRGG